MPVPRFPEEGGILYIRNSALRTTDDVLAAIERARDEYADYLLRRVAELSEHGR
jgi:hypothetical protein